MIDVGMIDGDMMVTEFGDIAIDMTDNDNIMQSINASIMTQYGSNINHPDYGNKVLNMRIKKSESGYKMIEEYCYECIMRDVTEVHEIVSISATSGDEYGECDVKYIVKTNDGESIDGRLSINLF